MARPTRRPPGAESGGSRCGPPPRLRPHGTDEAVSEQPGRDGTGWRPGLSRQDHIVEKVGYGHRLHSRFGARSPPCIDLPVSILQTVFLGQCGRRGHFTYHQAEVAESIAVPSAPRPCATPSTKSDGPVSGRASRVSGLGTRPASSAQTGTTARLRLLPRRSSTSSTDNRRSWVPLPPVATPPSGDRAPTTR